METFLPEWNTEVEVELPQPRHRKSLGVHDEVVELIWQNGEVVLLNQTHRNLTGDVPPDETDSWIHCPIDESFEKEFLADLSTQIPSSNPVEARKMSGEFEGADPFKFGSSDVNHFFPSLKQPTFETFDTSDKHHNLGDSRTTGNLELPVKRQRFDPTASDEICKCSVMAIGSSNCGRNQVANHDLDMSCGKNCAWEAALQSKSVERETLERAITEGSPTSFSKTKMHSNDNHKQKRKVEDVEETECRSDATESESAARNKPSSPKCGRKRRRRVAEVHNLSERKRRDRINEKLKALQELIPQSNKTGKASMLDDAIRYMKSLQLQLQLMRMRSGMAQVMIPGMQHYLSQVGANIGPQMLPLYQNLLYPNQATFGQGLILNPVTYQNQMQNRGFLEQYANYMGFPTMQNTSQLTNMFNFASHSTQQNRVLAQPSNGNGSKGWTVVDNVPITQ